MQDADTRESGIRLETEDAYESLLASLPVRTPKKILFIAIPLVPGDLFLADTARRNGYQAYPPLGYLYLASAAKLAIPDLELSILDLNCEMPRRSKLGILDDPSDFWKDLISREIQGSEQIHVCVGNSWGVMTSQFLAVLRFIRDTFPNVTLVTGGAETTLMYKRLIDEDYCHVAFRYQSEMEFKSFLEGCNSSGPAEVPKGIAFKTERGFYESNATGSPPELLDIRDSYDLINLEHYHTSGGMNPYSRYVGEEKTYATVIGNRGCRANCTFCGVKAFYPGPVRSRSPRAIVDEIKYLVEEKGVLLIEFLDDDLTYSRKLSIELFKTMAEELPPDFGWITQNGITGCTISEEIMYWIAESGCRGFKVGVETGNEARMRSIRKPATKDGVRKAGAMFKKYPQIHVSGNYLLGFPSETFSEMMETYNFARELDWDWANFIVCSPAGGTPMFEEFAELGDERTIGNHFGGNIPARSARQAGNFSYQKGYHSDDETSASLASGRDIFELPKDQIPSPEQLKEIWFSFNMEANFLNNTNFKPGGDVEKVVRWFESIFGCYPRDASMCAMLAHGYRLLGNRQKSEYYRDRFHLLHQEYDYWKRRVEEFPELEEYAG
jgi:radical SAM superfamily enzyme YgiQ (UPF0313 family)